MTLRFYYECSDCGQDLGTEKVKTNKLFATTKDYEDAPLKECKVCEYMVKPHSCRCE